MYIRVLYGSESMAVEPQGQFNRYTMGEVWGVKYNPHYSRDVTNQWGRYIQDR